MGKWKTQIFSVSDLGGTSKESSCKVPISFQQEHLRAQDVRQEERQGQPRRLRLRHRLRRHRIVATHADQVHVPRILGENVASFKEEDLDKPLSSHFPADWRLQEERVRLPEGPGQLHHEGVRQAGPEEGRPIRMMCETVARKEWH